MKKGLWMLLAGLMTLGASVSAFASARLDSMAADARQVGDIDLIWLYPNLVVNYKNTADFRLSTDGTYGVGSNEWGGALVGVNPDFGVLGVYVNRPEVELSTSANDGLWNFPLLSMLAFDQTGTGTLFITPYENQVDLFWGKNISGGNIGVHFNYGTGDDADYARDVYSLDAGLGLDNVGPFGVLNLHASYALNNLTDPSDPNDKSTGVFSATFGALASSDLDAENGIRIFTDANFDGYKAAEAPLALDLGYWGVDLGGSFNRKIDGGKGLLSTGLTLGYSSFTLWSTIPDGYADLKEWDVLWNASLEVPVNDWLTVRAGLAKLIYSKIYDKYDLGGNGTFPDNQGDNSHLSTGFGITWQNFTLNGSVTAGSLEDSINGVQPGSGIRFAGDILVTEDADLEYRF